MSIAEIALRALLFGSAGVLLFSSLGFAQFTGVEAGLSVTSYTSTSMQSAVSGGTWLSYGRSTVSYTGNKPAEQIIQMLAGADWRNYEKYGYAFTGQKIDKVVVDAWDTTGAAWAALGEFSLAWTGALLSVYNYTGAMNVGAETYDVVVNSIFAYNANQVTRDSTNMVFSQSGVVFMTLKETTAHTYGSGYELAITSEWDEDLGQYVLSGKDSTTKCSDALDSITFASTWSGSAWVLDERDVMSYNADRTISQVLTQTETSGTWADKERVVYGYGTIAMARELAGFMHAAQQKATRKLVSIGGSQRTATRQGSAFNVMGRHSVAPAPSAINFTVVKNTTAGQR